MPEIGKVVVKLELDDEQFLREMEAARANLARIRFVEGFCAGGVVGAMIVMVVFAWAVGLIG